MFLKSLAEAVFKGILGQRLPVISVGLTESRGRRSFQGVIGKEVLWP